MVKLPGGSAAIRLLRRSETPIGVSFSATTRSPTRTSARAACESRTTAVTLLRSSSERPKSRIPPDDLVRVRVRVRVRG